MDESYGKRYSEDLTQFLGDLRKGHAHASSDLMPVLYHELKIIAESCFRSQRASHTLQPTALVHEAYIRLMNRTVDWNDRVHFFAVASKAMRQLLVDHARTRSRKKRGGDLKQETLDQAVARQAGIEVDLLDLEEALNELTALDERQGRVVELRYFGGLEMAEVAEVLDISKTTAEREWRSARAWLGRRVHEGEAS